jgi:hypothetical protein
VQPSARQQHQWQLLFLQVLWRAGRRADRTTFEGGDTTGAHTLEQQAHTMHHGTTNMTAAAALFRWVRCICIACNVSSDF